jgi:hypothetical protein
MLLVAILDVEPDQVECFRAYETRVLALLAEHDGRLVRRLRSGDGTSEVHLLEFADEDGLRAYLDDPRRRAGATLLEGGEIASRLLRVEDVEP